MAAGERIHRYRKGMKMTQRYLGQILSFPANPADVRMVQDDLCLRVNPWA